jgi:hypothetical protein
LLAESGGTATEDFGFGGQLNMNLKSDDNLIS